MIQKALVSVVNAEVDNNTHCFEC